MSRLGNIESGIISRLSAAMIGGNAAFETMVGASGGNRAAIRAALRRERMPAAYVSFIDEPLGPEVRAEVRGAKFTVLVADQTLRPASNPRQGDGSTPGTFALLESARNVLDDYSPDQGVRLVAIHERFIEADDRVGIYELLYRAWPIDEIAGTSPQFDSVQIAGSLSDVVVEIGSFRVVPEDPEADPPMTYINTARPVVWRCEIRTTSHAQMWTLEDNIEGLIAERTVASIKNVHGESLDDCRIERYEREGPRRTVGTQIVQSAVIHFLQLTPVA